MSAGGTAWPHCKVILAGQEIDGGVASPFLIIVCAQVAVCPLYTSDAADERSSVDLGGRRIIKKKNVTVGVPHASGAVIFVISAGGTGWAQGSGVFGGVEMRGGVASPFLIIVCAQVA